MEGLVFLAAVACAALLVLGLVWAVASIVCWALVLPFKLLGLIFKGLAFVLALPILVIAAVLGFTVFGVFAIPALPFLLLVLFIVWLARRGRRSVVSA